MKITPEIAVEIVQLVADGKSFRQISRMQNMPSRSTMQRAYNEEGEADRPNEFKLAVDNARNSRLPRFSEGPTLERQRKDGGVAWEPIDRSLTGNVVQTRARVAVSSRLDWYLDKKTISQQMHDAGERMAKIMFHAGKHPRICIMFRERVSGLNGQSEAMLDKTSAQIALDDALAVLDSQERDAIWDVCALDNFAGNTRALVTGLRALVLHFRVIP